MQCRLILDTEEKRERSLKMGIKDPRKKYEIEDMVQRRLPVRRDRRHRPARCCAACKFRKRRDRDRDRGDALGHRHGALDPRRAPPARQVPPRLSAAGVMRARCRGRNSLDRQLCRAVCRSDASAADCRWFGRDRTGRDRTATSPRCSGSSTKRPTAPRVSTAGRSTSCATKRSKTTAIIADPAALERRRRAGALPQPDRRRSARSARDAAQALVDVARQARGQRRSRDYDRPHDHRTRALDADSRNARWIACRPH